MLIHADVPVVEVFSHRAASFRRQKLVPLRGVTNRVLNGGVGVRLFFFCFCCFWIVSLSFLSARFAAASVNDLWKEDRKSARISHFLLSALIWKCVR